MKRLSPVMALALLAATAGPSRAELQTLTYTYDVMGRLLTVTYGESIRTTYTYDAMSNITSIVTDDDLVGVEADGSSSPLLPAVYALAPVAPNPTRFAPLIRYQLPEEVSVRLRVYDAAGRLVRTLVSDRLPAGYHRTPWDVRDDAGREVSNGLYFYRLEAGGFVETRKVILVE